MESRPAESAATATASAGRQSEGGGPRSPQPLTVTVRESGAWPRTATTTLTVNPFTGEVLKREGFGDFTTGRQIRTWTRFLHTGQALGSGRTARRRTRLPRRLFSRLHRLRPELAPFLRQRQAATGA